MAPTSSSNLAVSLFDEPLASLFSPRDVQAAVPILVGRVVCDSRTVDRAKVRSRVPGSVPIGSAPASEHEPIWPSRLQLYVRTVRASRIDRQLIESFVHEDEWMDAAAAVHVLDAQVHAVNSTARSLLT